MDLSLPYFLLFFVRKKNRYQKVRTYEHSLQFFVVGVSSFEFEEVRLKPSKKYKRSKAVDDLTGRVRAPACWELMP